MNNKQLSEALRAISLDALPIKDRAAVLNAAEGLEIQITDKRDAVEKALRRAFNLGQIYWLQSDSEYGSQYKESYVTWQQFEALVTTTVAALDVAASKEGEA